MNFQNVVYDATASVLFLCAFIAALTAVIARAPGGYSVNDVPDSEPAPPSFRSDDDVEVFVRRSVQ